MIEPLLVRHRGWLTALAIVVLSMLNALSVAAALPDPPSRLLDDFEDIQGWSTVAASGAQAQIRRDAGARGHGLRIDFDLRGGGGYVIVHKRFSVRLPENYAFRFSLRAEGAPNTFELRLVDPSGESVWRHRRPWTRLASDWQETVLKQRQLEFAWGPAGDGRIWEAGLIEFVIARETGGRGTVWVDDLSLEPREPATPYTLTPSVRASSATAGQGADRVLDGDASSSWQTLRKRRVEWFLVDFHKPREYGGLVIDWGNFGHATHYSVQLSNDGARWQTTYRVTRGNGGRDYIPLPDAESRYLRLLLHRSHRDQGYSIRELSVQPLAFSATPNQFFEAIARDQPRGHYPRYLYGQQAYWTAIGTPGDEQHGGDKSEALLNEDGLLEVHKGGFSIEPFLYADGRLITWNDVDTRQSLAPNGLPIPSSSWRRGPLALTVTALAAGRVGHTVLYARYRVKNTGTKTQSLGLFLALRPFQVNPPWQSLNMIGGVSRITEIVYQDRIFRVNGNRAILAMSLPTGVGAAAFDEGSIMEYLARGALPASPRISDPTGYGSGALHYALSLEPGTALEIYLAIPLGEETREVQDLATGQLDPARLWQDRYAETVRIWEEQLGRVRFHLPPGEKAIASTLRTALAHILINRDGAALRPGSRCYERTWIRDGAVSSAALLALGHAREVRDFLRWYVRYQEPDGRLPCCLDPWGPDPMVEHDSTGEFIYTLAEYWRFTHDARLVHDLWPALVKAIDYVDALRRKRTTAEYQQGAKRVFYGLLPPSASHEGYAAHPVHSYWDDLWALRGLKDAALLAEAMGERDQRARFGTLRERFAHDLYASVARTAAQRGIDYMPGSVEFADYDPTSMAIAVTIAEELDGPLRPLLTRTFERYRAEIDRRQSGQDEWQAYSPYELRNVGALLRLGERDAALAALRFFLAGRRPLGWKAWPEVIWRDPRAPRFLGDLPHSWVGAEYINAVRSLFAYERGSDQTLVIGAGLHWGWIEGTKGVGVEHLPTHYGLLNYHIESVGANELRVYVSGDIVLPSGHIVINLPWPRPIKTLIVNGHSAALPQKGPVTIAEFPAEVVLRY